MKNLFKFLFVILLFIQSGCKKNDSTILMGNEDYLLIDTNLYDWISTYLYCYSKTGNKYNYVLCAYKNSGIWILPCNPNTNSLKIINGPAVKLRLQGDTMSELIGEYQIIPDTSCYVIKDPYDLSQKDYLLSGKVVFKSSGNTICPKINEVSFDGKTKTGKYISFHSKNLGLNMNPDFYREINGYYNFKGKKYDLSGQLVEKGLNHGDNCFIVNLRDNYISNSISSNIYFILYKQDDWIFDNTYIGRNNNPVILNNSFEGSFGYGINCFGSDTSYMFNQGEINIVQISDSFNIYNPAVYQIDFKIKTDSGDSLTGYWRSEIEIH